MTKCRIVIATGGLATYLQGGGHWAWLLQYLWGLRALGHEVTWLEMGRSSGNQAQDRSLADSFFEVTSEHGISDCCCLQLIDRDATDNLLGSSQLFGTSEARMLEIIRDSDVLWNMAGGMQPPLIGMFKRRALIDVDPGHFQVSAFQWDMGLDNHEGFLTVGLKMHDADCGVPTLGRTWKRFCPFVHLPAWNVSPSPRSDAPFTSVTHWTYDYADFEGRALSLNKRDAYLKYSSLPAMVNRPMELAVKLYDDAHAEDRGVLLANGWTIADPWDRCGSVAKYMEFIHSSRAEFCCPKPIHVDLNSGWFSDRSVAYLASGRPVLAEETGFSEIIPAGRGLLRFRNLEEAAAGVREIDENYDRHQMAAREIAEEYLDARRVLPQMIEDCF